MNDNIVLRIVGSFKWQNYDPDKDIFQKKDYERSYNGKRF